MGFKVTDLLSFVGNITRKTKYNDFLFRGGICINHYIEVRLLLHLRESPKIAMKGKLPEYKTV